MDPADGVDTPINLSSPGLLLAGVIISAVVIGLLAALLVRRLSKSNSKSNSNSKRIASHDQVLMEGIKDGFVIIDEKRRVSAYNKRLQSLLPGKVEQPQAGMDARNLYQQLCNDNSQALHKLERWLDDLPADASDSTANLELTVSNERLLLISEKSIEQGVVASTVRDISDRRSSARELSHARDFDALTGLPNRHSLMNSLRAAARQPSPEYALLVCDLRDFRQVNDSYGQYFADQLLIEVAARLQQAMPGNALVARIAGDEFGVLLNQRTDREQLQRRAAAFLEELGNGIAIAARVLPVRANMGLSFSPQDGSTVGEMKSAVDSAVAQAKTAGKNTFATYDRQWQQAADRAHQIDIGLEKALSRAEFSVQYQPQVDVHSNLTCGMEALLRWHSRSLGQVSPAEFIPRAERTDLITDIGEWVLRQSIADYRHLAKFGTSPASLSVNLSRRQFSDAKGIERLSSIIRQSGLAAELITLEITETALLEDRDKARDMLIALKGLGVQLSIDDFGVGYSSFAEMRDFPIDEVKIDRTFVTDLETCKKNQQIIRATVDVAHSLGAEVVAEGIESLSQFERVAELGCDRAQGFFLCEPMHATMFPDVCLGASDADSPLEATILVDD